MPHSQASLIALNNASDRGSSTNIYCICILNPFSIYSFNQQQPQDSYFKLLYESKVLFTGSRNGACLLEGGQWGSLQRPGEDSQEQGALELGASNPIPGEPACPYNWHLGIGLICPLPALTLLLRSCSVCDCFSG